MNERQQHAVPKFREIYIERKAAPELAREDMKE